MRNPTVTRQEIPDGLTEDMELILVPDRVEGVREGKFSSGEDREVLIKWKDLPTYEATWELYSIIQKQSFLISTLRTRWLFGRGVLIRPGSEKLIRGVQEISGGAELFIIKEQGLVIYFSFLIMQ